MKKNPTTPSQDYDRKHGKNHIAMNSRAAKDAVSDEDCNNEGSSDATDEIIAKGHIIANNPSAKSSFTEDKRATARQEHTNHFTNRAKPENQ